MEKHGDIVTSLELSNYPRVMDHLDNATTKVMAVVIIQSIMKIATCVSTSDKVIFYLCCSYIMYFFYVISYWVLHCYFLQVEALFELIKGLIKDMDGAQDDEV